jgi:toxin FitB
LSYLLDTSALSEWAKPRPDPGIALWLDEVDEDRVYLSVITLGELRRASSASRAVGGETGWTNG